MEHLASLAGFFPYTCRDCRHRSMRRLRSAAERGSQARTDAEKEVVAIRAAAGRRRKKREVALYTLALLIFVVILYFLTRQPFVDGV